MHLHNQKIESYRGNYENFLKTKTENLKNQQREYEAQLEYRQHIQIFIDRFRYNANRASQVQSKIKMLEKLYAFNSVIIKYFLIAALMLMLANWIYNEC